MRDTRIASFHARTSLRESGIIVQPSVTAEDDGIFFGTESDDWLSTVPQFPHLDGRGGHDKLTGDERDNRLYGQAGDDQLFGQAGNDQLDGGAGEDTMDGGSGADTYFVDRFNDTVIEQADGGYDIIIADPFGGSATMGAHVEEMFLTGTGWRAGFGNDQDNRIVGTDDVNLLYGHGGNDVIYGLGGTDRIYGDGINEPVFGNDVLYGGDGDDALYGGQGNGADMLSGSVGYDTAYFGDAQAGVTIDLTKPFENAGGAEGDVLIGIENLHGSAFDDTIFGAQSRNVVDAGKGDDRLYGREGGDTLRGNVGNDFIDGGSQRDVLTGGEGADTFYFASPDEGGDTITDFSSGDHIALSAAGFELESVDDFAFALTSDPLTETPTAIYNAASGNLSWDSDGSGAAAAVYLATLNGTPTLSQDDFLVV